MFIAFRFHIVYASMNPFLYVNEYDRIFVVRRITTLVISFVALQVLHADYDKQCRNAA